MIACLLSHGFEALDFDIKYEKPVSHNLHNLFCAYIQDLQIDEIISLGSYGPENIFIWAGLACGARLKLVLPCQDYERLFALDHREHFENNKKAAYAFVVLGDRGWNEAKSLAAKEKVVGDSDIIFVLWDGKGSPPGGFVLAQGLDKEIIIINPKELEHETVETETNKKTSLEAEI